MEELCKDLKLIYDDENVIGKVKDIMEMMFRMVKYDIDNIDDIEEKLISISEKTELIDTLREINNTDIIKVYANPMGGFNYEGV